MHGDTSLDSPEARRFRHALQMAELGISMYRQRMRRERPEASEEEIEAEVRGRSLTEDLEALTRKGGPDHRRPS